jgi:hypothetical protein
MKIAGSETLQEPPWFREHRYPCIPIKVLVRAKIATVKAVAGAIRESNTARSLSRLSLVAKSVALYRQQNGRFWRRGAEQRKL